MLKATIDAAVRSAEFERVIVGAMQEKAIAYPTDSRLRVIARHRVVKAVRSYTRLYCLKGRYPPLALRSCESRATSQPLSTCPLLPGAQKRRRLS